MFKRKWFAYPYLGWMILFTVIPMLLVVYFAFTNSGGSFTLDNMKAVFQPMYLRVLGISIWLAFLCTLICLLVGYPAALILADRHVKNSSLWLVLFMLPMWMNFLVRTYAWMSLLEGSGIINTLFQALGLPKMQLIYNQPAILLGLVYNFLPFMILPIHSVLTKMDHSLIEAAQDLGGNPLKVFAKVTLPLSVPGVLSGVTMVFVPAVTTFVISRLLGGSQILLYGDVIEQQFLKVGDWNMGSALSLVVLLLLLISMTILNRFGGKEEGRTML